MSIDPRGDRAVYRQLADLLREQIQSGDLLSGRLLPSENRIAQQYGIGREAVRQAVAVLRSEGLVSTVRGEGTRVRQPVERESVRLGRTDRAVARMPVESERRELDLDEGVPVVEVTRADGATELHRADRTEFFGR
jgi:DNA-binding GntR family transcriptional regulator